MKVLTNTEALPDGGGECYWAVVVQTEGFGHFADRDNGALFETCGNNRLEL